MHPSRISTNSTHFCPSTAVCERWQRFDHLAVCVRTCVCTGLLQAQWGATRSRWHRLPQLGCGLWCQEWEPRDKVRAWYCLVENCLSPLPSLPLPAQPAQPACVHSSALAHILKLMHTVNSCSAVAYSRRRIHTPPPHFRSHDLLCTVRNPCTPIVPLSSWTSEKGFFSET